MYVLQQKERYPNFPFSIDEDGKIYVTEPLDREERENVIITFKSSVRLINYFSLPFGALVI